MGFVSVLREINEGEEFRLMIETKGKVIVGCFEDIKTGQNFNYQCGIEELPEIKAEITKLRQTIKSFSSDLGTKKELLEKEIAELEKNKAELEKKVKEAKEKPVAKKTTAKTEVAPDPEKAIKVGETLFDERGDINEAKKEEPAPEPEEATDDENW